MRLASALLACAGSAAAILSASFFLAPGITVSAAPASVVVEPIEPPAPADGFGTIKGKVIFGGDAPALPEVDAKGKEFCETQKVLDRSLVVDPKSKGVANVLVWVVAPKGKNPAAEKALLAKTPVVSIDNHNCEFVPRNTAMMKGQQLDFTSSDPVGHNSHVTSMTTYGCNLALTPKGKATAPKVQPGGLPMKLKCDIHSWMEGNILVLDHPFSAVTGEDGTFVIQGVPADTQNLIIWHEKVGFVSTGAKKGQPVDVKADGTTDLGDVKIDPTKVRK